MRGKFKLTCQSCGCTAELSISERPLVTPYACQSCGQELSPADHEKLDTVIQALYSLPDFTSESDGFVVSGKGFQIKLTPCYPDKPVE